MVDVAIWDQLKIPSLIARTAMGDLPGRDSVRAREVAIEPPRLLL